MRREVATKEELEQQVERLQMLLGAAFMLIPPSRTRVFFERVEEISKLYSKKEA